QLVCLISVGNAALFADSFDGAVYTETELTVLRRAARVFEQAYVRFLDLQKVEAQAKEAQIEAALERVRSRSMAMHKSEELSEVASVLFHQLQGLGIDSLRRSAVNIMNESEAVWECWYTSLHGDSFAHLVKIPVLGNPAVAALTSSWQKQELFKVELAGAALNDFMQFLISHGWKYAPGDSAPQKFTMSGLPFSHGVVLTFTSETLKAEEIEILKRFAIVFEQCYTRFLDLQKAEVQTRESEIELALERVRARTMSMQKSEDLREVVKVLYVQLKELGFKNGLAAINIMDSDSGDVDSWSEGFDDGYDLPEKYRVPYFEHNGHRALISHWKSGGPYAEVEIAGEDKKSFDNYYFFHTDFVKVPEATKQFMMQPEAILFSMAYMQYGALTWAPTPISEEQSKILQRFAKVFEQTYTRFLDLQKAEAQAREAQIEAALERVRSKTMAMHNSQDVGVSVAALFNELEMLGILDPQDRCGIGIMQTDEIMEVWTAAKTLEGKDELTIGTLDMKVHPLLQQAYLGWKTKKESNQYILEGDDKTRYYQAIRDQQNYTLKRDYFSDYTKVIHTDFYFNEGCLFVFSRNEFQAGPSAIIIRFANLFGQTYRRYLDLQKAETQAREATIEAALEKVRGKALAMHNSNDLTVTAGIVFTELRKLGINSLRGGVGLIDNKESRLCKMYSATSSGEGDTLSLVGTILLNGHPVLSKIWDNIIDQSDYFPVLKGELLESYYTHLSSTFNVPFAKSTHKEEYGCFLTFSEGGFYVWSEKPYT
ncbi:MAG: hypothetical protein JNL53_05030, partial [Cyclobacteriaceae bacterium]|nr:hypothetical protein [Cyclobacteriaceae bacterium]